MSQKKIVILGSTGSIGVQTLDLVQRNPERFTVMGLVAGRKTEIFAEQIVRFQPTLVSVFDEVGVGELKSLLKAKAYIKPLEILHGEKGACQVAGMDSVDLVISAIVGAAGLIPTAEAIKRGRTIGLANKESLVIAGAVMTELAKKHGATLLPVDSEHSAIFQSMAGSPRERVRKIILTASGGPFFKKPLAELKSVTVEEALKHPNWAMGPKITIDSATMMNKGLEVIEAYWLFQLPPRQIDVVIHPQSIIHSMVEYIDGSVIAQMGVPDMRCPIAYAMAYPDRMESGVKPLDLIALQTLSFFKPDPGKFRCLQLAFDALQSGGSAPVVLNAANEVAVARFLKRELNFLGIAALIEKVLNKHKIVSLKSLNDVTEADRWAREVSLRA